MWGISPEIHSSVRIDLIYGTWMYLDASNLGTWWILVAGSRMVVVSSPQKLDLAAASLN